MNPLAHSSSFKRSGGVGYVFQVKNPALPGTVASGQNCASPRQFQKD